MKEVEWEGFGKERSITRQPIKDRRGVDVGGVGGVGAGAVDKNEKPA